MKPTKHNTHGSRSNKENPMTGLRFRYETEQLERHAAANELAEMEASLAEELQLLERQQIALEARDKLLTYVKFTMPDGDHPSDVSKSAYRDQGYHRAIASALEKWSEGQDEQIIICLPPGHGKSQLCTKHLTSWLSGRNPSWNIIVGTYSDGLAEDFGGDIRNIMNSPQHKQVFPGYHLQKGGTSKTNMLTHKGGRILCAGRGVGITGKRAHALIIDDLYKDFEEARSPTIRDLAWNWFTKAAMTRRMGPKLVIVTFTRWHSDDIIGRLTDPNNPNYNSIIAKQWKIIKLPAIAGEDDPAGRKPGEPLWPEEFGLKYLMNYQAMDPLGFAGLFQQEPTVADGTLFSRDTIQRYEPNELPENLRYYASSDHALDTKSRHDPSCFLKGGVDKQGNLWLTDIFWKRVKTDVAIEMMLEMGAGEPVAQRPLVWWAERGHISKSIGPFLTKRMQETGKFIRIQEVTPIGDKEQRAQSISARVALGKVYFPKGAIWDKAVEEMMAFPNGLHDDFVDALSLFGLALTSQFGKGPKEEKKEPRFGSVSWLKDDMKRQADMSRSAVKLGGF